MSRHSPVRPAASHVPRATRHGARHALAALALAACSASTSGGSGAESLGPQQRRETFVIEGAVLQYFPSAGTTPHETELAVPVARAWQVLPDVYEQLGLQMNEIIPAERRIGTGMIRAQGRLGRNSLSRLIDCGYTSGIANADSYAINFLVRTQIVPSRDSTSTVVRTLVLASGRQSATGGGGVVSCPSSGELERQVAQQVRAHVLAKTGA